MKKELQQKVVQPALTKPDIASLVTTKNYPAEAWCGPGKRMTRCYNCNPGLNGTVPWCITRNITSQKITLRNGPCVDINTVDKSTIKKVNGTYQACFYDGMHIDKKDCHVCSTTKFSVWQCGDANTVPAVFSTSSAPAGDGSNQG